jgi:hypothetical protein
MKELSPDIVLPISSVPGHVGVAFGASPDEFLWLTASARPALEPIFAPGTPVDLHSFRPGPEITTRKYRGRQRPHFIQRTPDGILFANARQRDQAPNAWLMNDRTGTLGGFLGPPATTPLGKAQLRKRDPAGVVRRLSLGDGLSDVRVSAAGKIWAAYFDEGVFGSGDGAEGVVARDGAGRKIWAFDAGKAGTDDVADVYAFNLSAEDDAWVYFYTPFTIVRWRKNKPTVWQTRVQGARAMAVRSSEALLFGDYDDPISLRVLDLPAGGGRARVKRRLRLRLPSGTDVASIHAFGAAHRIALWSNRDLMILDRW